MRKIIKNILLASVVGLSMNVLALDLKPDAPSQYTVQKGDTLWDISKRFTDDPWYWPEIWYRNSQIEDPHLIYPGDIIGLVDINGETRVTLKRRADTSVNDGRTVKLQPSARVEGIDSAIPAVPQDAIRGFLQNHQVTTKEALDNAPRIIAGREGRVMMGAGDRIYARGDFGDTIAASYGVYRRGVAYFDPNTREFLGLEAQEIGRAKVIAEDNGIVSLELVSTNQQVAAGDLLLSVGNNRIASNYYPKAADAAVAGNILAVSGGVSQIGQFDIVVLNRGTREGVDEGTVFTVNKLGAVVRDRIGGDRVRLPNEKAGSVMVFKAYDKMSYGLIMSATQAMAVGDSFTSPNK